MKPRHPYLDVLEPYEPPDLEAAAARADVNPDDLVRLMANENLYGPSPEIACALGDFGEFNIYPDYGLLKERVAGYAGVRPDQVVLSNGADELIDLLTRLLVEPGEAVVICPPTFGMYHFYARVNRCEVIQVPCRDDLTLDIAGIERAVEENAGDARLLFLVSPGNPSGRAVPLHVVAHLLALPLTVVVDEAYIEYGGESAVELLSDHENLVVIRTFSKWAGMAGLRLGYALLAPRMANYVERIRPPYNVNAAAMVAALTTFDDLDTVRGNVAALIKERERLRKALAQIPWLKPLPSQANFLLCRVEDGDVQRVTERLERKGIFVRTFSNPTLADTIRISIGRPFENDALLAVLEGCR